MPNRYFPKHHRWKCSFRCALENEDLIVFKRASGLQGRAMAHEFSCRPLTTQARVRSRSRSRSRPLEIVMDMLVLGQVSPRVFRLSIASINPLLPHAWVLKKDKQAKGKEKAVVFGYWEALGRKVISHCSFFRPQAKKVKGFRNFCRFCSKHWAGIQISRCTTRFLRSHPQHWLQNFRPNSSLSSLSKFYNNEAHRTQNSKFSPYGQLLFPTT